MEQCQLHAGSVAYWFKRDYRESKKLFDEYCQGLTVHAWNCRSWILPHAPSLSTDCVWIGDRDADTVVVLISGTHDVEGYSGSAAQSFVIHCLEQGALRLPASMSILLIHALNPWGMHWARRCDEDGIDINRNFVDFNCLPQPCTEYEKILESLVIENISERHRVLNDLRIAWGQPDFDRIFSGGQYHCSWSPFYGGQQPSYASRVVDGVIEHWQLDKRCLIVLDLHTGLGPWAYGELISDHPVASQGNHFARQLFNDGVAMTEKGESFSVAKQGLLDYRWHRMMEKKGCFLTLEFGSRGTNNLFDVLLSEHLFWRDWNNRCQSDVIYRRHRQAMLNHFCPDDSIWQQAVLFRTYQIFERIFGVTL